MYSITHHLYSVLCDRHPNARRPSFLSASDHALFTLHLISPAFTSSVPTAPLRSAHLAPSTPSNYSTWVPCCGRGSCTKAGRHSSACPVSRDWGWASRLSRSVPGTPAQVRARGQRACAVGSIWPVDFRWPCLQTVRTVHCVCCETRGLISVI